MENPFPLLILFLKTKIFFFLISESIKSLIEREYRDVLYPDDLKDPNLLDESRRVLDELTQIFSTGSIYEFQKL